MYNFITPKKSNLKENASMIIEKYENNIINAIIEKNYSCMSSSEQMFISKESKIKLIEHRTEILEYIIDKLKEFQGTQITTHGFVFFRLKEYNIGIKNAVDSAVAEFITKREYEELINGLILYTEFQESVIDELNIVKLKNKYIVFENNGNEIVSVSKFDDILLDILLTLAPKKIYLYNPELFQNKNLLNTITRIFQNRISIITDIIEKTPTNSDKE